MDSYFFLVPWVLSSFLIFPAAAKDKDVIHLDLSPLRQNAADSNTPPSTEQADTIAKKDPRVYCTDTTFPNDIFCDITSMERGEVVKVRPFTTDVYLKFPHATRSGAECFVSFENSTIPGQQSRLLYKSYSCYDSSNSTADWMSNVEWMLKVGQVQSLPGGAPPENLKVGDVDVLEIEDTSPEKLALKCKRRLTRVKDVEPTQPSSVAFNVDEMACISTAPPQELPLLPAIETEVVPETQ